MIDFDDIDEWEPELSAALSPHLPDSVGPTPAAVAPEYVEDALDLLFGVSRRDAIIDATLTWIRSTSIAGYHGTRLTDTEMASIRATGLVPLKAEARRNRLIRALSPHPDWPRVADKLDAAMQGSDVRYREGQVHLTLSKAGLTNGFNHYLTHGSEFDQHLAYKLLGLDGKELLAHDGESTVICFSIPGPLALDAANQYFDIDTVRARGGIPNLVNEFLTVWSYRLAHPEFQSRTLESDCGMMFRSTVPADWIIDFDMLFE